MRKLLVLSMFGFLCLLPLAAGGNRQRSETSPTTPIAPAQSEQPLPVAPPGSDTPTQPPTVQCLAEHLWQLFVIPYDAEELQELVNTQISAGFRPTGLHVNTGQSIAVLFSRIPLSNRRWAFAVIEPLSELNEQMTAYILNGWIPTDISFGVNDLHSLFLVSDAEVLSWRIITVNVEESMQNTLLTMSQIGLEQARQDFFLFGISTRQNTIELLYIRTDIPPVGSRVVFRAFPNDGISPLRGIDLMVSQGALPAGIAVTEDWFIVPFYQ